MPRPTRIVEHRQGGFDPISRRWLLLLYREPSVQRSAPPLARVTLDVREDPDLPGGLLVTVRGAARVTQDGRAVEPLPAVDAVPGPPLNVAQSVAAKASALRRRCPSCGRGGGLAERADGTGCCRWCAFVDVEHLRGAVERLRRK